MRAYSMSATTSAAEAVPARAAARTTDKATEQWVAVRFERCMLLFSLRRGPWREL
jgi:hypothetical protein